MPLQPRATCNAAVAARNYTREMPGWQITVIDAGLLDKAHRAS